MSSWYTDKVQLYGNSMIFMKYIDWDNKALSYNQLHVHMPDSHQQLPVGWKITART